MSPRYRRYDGTEVDTKNSTLTWPRETETLHRSRRGRYFIEFHGERVEWLSKDQAVRWLVAHDVPAHHPDFPYDLFPYVPAVKP
jgi:hypothetical protein